MIGIQSRITKRLDGSYLIDQGYGPGTYHAHKDETPDQWLAAEAYASAYPDLVDYEQEPDPQEIERQRIAHEIESNIARIKRRLAAIDTETIRPIRAKLSGSHTSYDTDKLAALEAEASQLRQELATMEILS